jgi:hypothetical protein
MDKLVVTEFVTLDGVMEDPGGAGRGRGGWAVKFDQGDHDAHAPSRALNAGRA